MEKYEESLSKAVKSIETADHMTYVTYPLIKEKRLLLRILTEIYEGLLNLINSVLQYEYYYKRINLYNTPRDNFETFKNISKSYGVADENISRILEVFRLVERHKKSPFEFVKDDKIIIMSEGIKTDVITIEKIKFFLLEAKELLKKVRDVIKKRI